MRYYLLTLGCPKNTVDSEAMAMLLRRQGHEATTDPQRADVLIVNTCGFLQASQDESLAVLQELGRRKRRHQLLIAAGCLAQRAAETILTRAPQVDGVLGTRRWVEITTIIERLRAAGARRPRQRYQLLGDPEGPLVAALEEAYERPPAIAGSAYLKISEGCNAPCAFCTIPSFKGRLRSRPPEAIVAEAKALVAQGARELVVVAQDTTDYGRDRGEPDALPRLLTAIAREVEGLRWLRLMYAYPGHVSDALIETMATCERIVHYLDMPLQHAHPDTLRHMRRPAPALALDHIRKLRAAMPDIALRTTFIVGYPGETEAEFQTLLDFVAEARFDRVGVFQFSAEPGTPAADLPDQVPAEVKAERWARLMELQQTISRQRNQEQIGRLLDVLVEGYDRGIAYGRSYRDAPEVDGLVFFGGRAPIGELAPVRITGAIDYDLEGEWATPSGNGARAEIPLL